VRCGEAVPARLVITSVVDNSFSSGIPAQSAVP
jgi:hypothetical protein